MHGGGRFCGCGKIPGALFAHSIGSGGRCTALQGTRPPSDWQFAHDGFYVVPRPIPILPEFHSNSGTRRRESPMTSPWMTWLGGGCQHMSTYCPEVRQQSAAGRIVYSPIHVCCFGMIVFIFMIYHTASLNPIQSSFP